MAYAGNDGYAQTYAYSLPGVRTEKREQGDPRRMTLEELLAVQGEEEGERNVGTLDTGWIETRYTQDITLAYPQVLMETGAGGESSYAYGLQRLTGIATAKGDLAQTELRYVYDGRGSV